MVTALHRAKWHKALAASVSTLLAGSVLVVAPATAVVSNTGQQDTSFTPPVLNGRVYSAVQLKVGDHAGKYLIGGQFAEVDGDLNTNFVARLNADGTRDTSFTPLTLGGPVWSVTELQVGGQAGKYLIGGEFANDATYRRVARLNTDGTRDTGFTPPTLNNEVRSVVELSDGKYLIGGDFSNAGYVRMARLNAADGTRDTSFTPPVLDQAVNSIAVLKVGGQAGKYLIGGWFTNVGGDDNTDHVARLDPADGARDTSFTPLALNNVVHSIAELSDGKYLIGGEFSNTGYVNVARLLAADGARDTSFTPLTLSAGVLSVAPLADGKYLIGGYFEDAGGNADTDYVARLQGSDGSRDETFEPLSLNAWVQTVVGLSDGKYLIGGQFMNTGYDRLARLGETVDPGFLPEPHPVVFGDQGVGTTSAARSMKVTNSGAADLEISSVSVAGADAAQFAHTGGTCGLGAVAPGAHCTVDLTFTPSSTGAKAAELHFATNLSTPTQSVAVQGTGIPADAVNKPRRPKAVKVAGGLRAAKYTVSWVKPSVAGDRPITSYRLVVRQRGVSKPVLRKTVSGSQTSAKFTRKQLLKHSALSHGLHPRGDVRSAVVYRVVVESVNPAGHSRAATASFVFRR